MDATLRSKKAPPATAAATVPSSAPQQAAEQSSPPPESYATTVAGAVKASGSGGEDDDEQVERFYALLDNIRAMRGMVSTGGTGTAAGRKKRARDAEPPWRPAFRMEDFEMVEEVDSDSVGCAGEKKKKMKRESSAKRPVADEEEQEGEVVVEATKGRRRGQPHKARRAGVLAVDG
ncbi:hypothetical protein BDA96_09G121000 [Sorghum bicolor]|uniref:NRR repressor homolog 1 n=2 Tax=Sorghum bicolor TaxID=4558 RepID=A0A921QCH6_SORBI|nr:NRR repressor homolog 1 [Sorghum bicolor]EES18100.1 hypothetical protein SORBI_3009G115300 [Sorghum bicolor]KAG0517806.1 hypothetical protein BDA96_09G121000 [Sorghum bicolor]|eukprot:XP_002439670.1 NRR repressor homolog 1 [Sorghum bicolor]